MFSKHIYPISYCVYETSVTSIVREMGSGWASREPSQHPIVLCHLLDEFWWGEASDFSPEHTCQAVGTPSGLNTQVALAFSGIHVPWYEGEKIQWASKQQSCVCGTLV